MFTDVRRFPSIDSTNRYLLDEARAGAGEGVVAVADYQTAGRGRLGRRWEAPPGSNLLASVLLRPPLGVEERHLASAAVALAAREAAQSVAGVAPAVKWPNDLVADDGRKVAGILAETDLGDGPPGGSDPPPGVPLPAAVVVGIGVNVNWPAPGEDLPEELTGIACSLRELAGRPLEVSTLLEALLVSLEPRVGDLGTPAGRRRLAGEFERASATVGSRVRVVLPDEEFEGIASGLTREGHLIVEAAGGPRTVVAGDVVHLRPGHQPSGSGNAPHHG